MRAAILGALLLALFVSRTHFHFHFSLEMSRETKSRWQSPTPQSLGKYTETRRDGQGALPGEGRRPARTAIADRITAVRAIADSRVTAQIDQARKKAQSDIESALVNLGVEKRKAGRIAAESLGEGKDFESRIKWAINRAMAAYWDSP